jgi:hypothetical protein
MQLILATNVDLDENEIEKLYLYDSFLVSSINK